MINNMLEVYRGNDISITKKIKLSQPTLQDIIDFGESEYFQAIHSLCAVGADFKWQLWDSGIDYTTISDYDLFLFYISNMLGSKKNEIKKIINSNDVEKIEKIKEEDIKKMTKNPLGLILNIDLADFKLCENKKNNENILYNEKEDIVIDRLVYNNVVEIIRKIHGLKRNNELPANERTKLDMIEDSRDEYYASLGDKNKEFLYPLVSTVANLGIGYTWFNVWDLKVCAFFECITRDNKISETNLLLKSAYGGFGSLKGVPKERLNKYR